MRVPSKAACLAALALAGSVVLSCSLVSLGGISLVSHPSTRGEVIGIDEPVTIAFSVPVVRLSAESLLRVSSADGVCTGDLSWEGNLLSFTPVPPLPRGRRLLLAFAGDLAAVDGRTFAVSLEVPFFVGTDEEPPRLLLATPADGGVIGTHDPLLLRFSAPVDRDSFASAFTLSPSADFVTTWDAAAATATVAPRTSWTNLTCYRWRIGTDLATPSGVRAVYEEEGRFVVQLDAAGPAVTRIQPAQLVGETFYPVDDTLSALTALDSILVTFSEPVSLPTLEAGFSVEPAIAGHILAAGEAQYAFVPDEPWQMATTYHLRIAAEVEDLAGNRMGVVQEQWFQPAIPEQRIESLAITGVASPITVFCAPEPVECTLDVSGEILLTFQFAESYAIEDRPRVQAAITFEAFYPNTLADPQLESAAWSSATQLSMRFGGFSVGTETSPHYYRIVAPGGADGIANAAGSYLAEDTWAVIVVR